MQEKVLVGRGLSVVLVSLMLASSTTQSALAQVSSDKFESFYVKPAVGFTSSSSALPRDVVLYQSDQIARFAGSDAYGIAFGRRLNDYFTSEIECDFVRALKYHGVRMVKTNRFTANQDLYLLSTMLNVSFSHAMNQYYGYQIGGSVGYARIGTNTAKQTFELAETGGWKPLSSTTYYFPAANNISYAINCGVFVYLKPNCVLDLSVKFQDYGGQRYAGWKIADSYQDSKKSEDAILAMQILHMKVGLKYLF